MNTSTISAGRPGHKKLLFKYSSQSAFRFRCILDDLMRDQHIKDYYDIYGEDLQDAEETSYFNNSNNDDLRSCITGFTAATGVTNKSQSHVSKIQIKNQTQKIIRHLHVSIKYYSRNLIMCAHIDICTNPDNDITLLDITGQP